MHGRIFAVAAVALFVGGGSGAASPPLKVTSISQLSQLPTPLPFPYDEKANADAQVNAALAEAKRQHKLAFIDLGGNWCGDCRVLSSLMELPEVKRFVEAHYVVVEVDVGRFKKNLQIPARWGITKRLEGVPAVLIVDPKTNTLLNKGHVAALADARHMTPQGIADWIEQWVR
ncbi:MAG: thioredoxin family protein [Alphaproteobacteria bacterium]|nr:thioredoxin family protein [Alphaproteobacteria bacterium]